MQKTKKVAASVAERSPHKAAPPLSPVPSLNLSKVQGGRVTKKLESQTDRVSPPKKCISLPASARPVDNSLTVQTLESTPPSNILSSTQPNRPKSTKLISPTKHAIRTTPLDVQLRNELEKLTALLRTNRDKTIGNIVSLQHQKLGDQYTYSVIRGLGAVVTGADEGHAEQRTINTIYLRDNRITDGGFEKILRAIRSDSTTERSLKTLDIGENVIRRKGTEELCLLLKSTTPLAKLVMDHMKVGDKIARSIGSVIGDASTASNLTSLDLSTNQIGDMGSVGLCLALKPGGRLTELDLSYNEIREGGAVALFQALQTNTSLRTLNLSWNSIGAQGCEALSTTLSSNTTLVHLDLSQNNLTAQDCEIIGLGLKANRSLLGLHMIGNEGRSDVYGNLLSDVEKWPLESAHAMTRLIGSRVHGREQWMSRSACWICGCFREKQFSYTLLDKDVLAMWGEIEADSNAKAAILAAERAAALKRQKEEAAARAADPYGLSTKLKTATNSPINKAASDPQKIKPIPSTFPISVQIACSFDGWVPEPMAYTQLSKELLAAFQHTSSEECAGHVDHARFRREVGMADETAILASLSREKKEYRDRYGSPLKARVPTVAVPRATSCDIEPARLKLDDSVELHASSVPVEVSEELAFVSRDEARKGDKEGCVEDGVRGVAEKKCELEAAAEIEVVAEIEVAAPEGCSGLETSVGSETAAQVLDDDDDDDDDDDAAAAAAAEREVECVPGPNSKPEQTEGAKASSSDDAIDALDAAITTEESNEVHPETTSNASGEGQATLQSPPPLGVDHAAPHVDASKQAFPHFHKSTSSPSFDIWRMVPPGVHYYVFKVSSGPLCYDPWQPHVRTADLVDLCSMRVPAGVVLPEYVNTILVDGPSEKEKLQGLDAFVNIAVQPRVRNSAVAQAKKVWVLRDSLFYATQPLYEERHSQRCFAADWAQMRAAKGREKVIVDQVHEVLSHNFTLLNKVYCTYSMLYSSELYFLGVGAFNELVTKCLIIEISKEAEEKVLEKKAPGAGKNAKTDQEPMVAPFMPSKVTASGPRQQSGTIDKDTAAAPASKPGATSSSFQCKGATRTELELIFVANAITGPRHEANSKRALARFQFLDSLVQASVVKFVKTGISPDTPSALRRMLRNHIEPYAEYEREDGFADFRHSYMLTEEIDMVFKRNTKKFERVFKKYSGLENDPNDVEKTMSYREWLEFCDKAEVSSLGLGDRSRQLVFIRSKITSVDHFDESNSYRRLTYLEFLYAVARSAMAIKLSVMEQQQLAAQPDLTSPSPFMDSAKSSDSEVTPGQLVEYIDLIAMRC